MFKKIMIGTVAFVVALFAAFVWPTQFRYDKMNQKWPVRINRFTGETDILGWNGWEKATPPAPTTQANSTTDNSTTDTTTPITITPRPRITPPPVRPAPLPGDSSVAASGKVDAWITDQTKRTTPPAQSVAPAPSVIPVAVLSVSHDQINVINGVATITGEVDNTGKGSTSMFSLVHIILYDGSGKVVASTTQTIPNRLHPGDSQGFKISTTLDNKFTGKWNSYKITVTP